MAEESHTFVQTRARLEEIVAQVRKKDTSLEASLDLLEEGVRLANQCTELIDRADWDVLAAEGEDGVSADAAMSRGVEAEDGPPSEGDTPDAPVSSTVED